MSVLKNQPSVTFALVLATVFSTASAQQPAQVTSVPTNSITQAAIKSGIQTCAGRINQVTNFIGANSQVGAFLFSTPSQPDQRLVSISMELVNKDKGAPNAYASASFAPNQANGCGAVYDAVVYWPQKCESVAAKRFGEMQKGRKLQNNITVLEGSTPTRVFLMPAGSGCVSIKKEVVL
jgi:hypothetical protein